MPIRTYRMTSTSTATAVGQATTTIVARGEIVGVALTVGAIPAGAGTIASEVALNNTSNGNATTATGAPTENLLARAIMALGSSGATANNITTFVPMSKRVEPGNQLCINVIQTGTAASSAVHGYDVMVKE